MSNAIKHVWFDMDGTLTIHTPEFDEVHNALRYKAYSDVTGRPVDDSLITEYEALYKKYSSNSAVFTSLGKPSDFWMHYYSQIDQTEFYEPEADVYGTVDRLRTIVPISLFTNDRLGNATKTLSVVNVDVKWFIHPPYILDTFTKLERSESENAEDDRKTAPGLRSPYPIGLVSQSRGTGQCLGGLQTLRYCPQ